jgi:Eco57I restriction-modification methylase
MVPGIGGSLLAGSFLQETVLPEVATTRLASSRTDHARLQRWWRRAEQTLGPATSARVILDVAAVPLAELLGYDVLHIEPHGHGFAGVLGSGGVPVATLTSTRWGDDAEAAWRDAVRSGRSAGVRWGLVFNGPTLRLVDASRTWARRALDVSFADALGDERAATLLRGLCQAAALVSTRDAPAALDRFVTRSDDHAAAICASLGDGVLEALTAIVNAFEARPRGHARRPRLEPRQTFEQALTLVYRLLFLLFAEARALVPTWHQVYREAYTIDALCRRTVRRGDAAGLWAALQAISRLAHAGCRAGDLVVTPFNGRLFSPRHTPLAESGHVEDRVVGQAVLSLATRPSPGGRTRVSYADLGVEELGAVYERVLEYEPRRTPGALVLTPTSTERKTTGSFYTPRAMTEFLVRRTLHPLVAGRSADDILRLRVLDPAMGSGAFLVAACRFLADAAARAIGRDAARHTDDPPGHVIELRRLVAERCLYGVDLNPMAVQLARLSLWLTTLAIDRPLTFLDHHLAVGDSLVGASLRDVARQRPGPRRRGSRHDGTLPLFAEHDIRDMAEQVLPDRFRLASEPSTTPEIVHGKERALARLSEPGMPLARWKAAADLWCAEWFTTSPWSRGVYEDVLAHVLSGRGTLTAGHLGRAAHESAARASDLRFFHWELEFPEVFHAEDGRRDPEAGFDAVIGNPPWDALRADTGDRAAREQARPNRRARLRFFRDAGMYRLQSAGHVNRYQLFLERALQLARPGGRVGLILPSGLATDHGSSALRRALLDEVAVERLHGFENRRRIFPIHRDTKFLLLTAARGGRTDRLTCAFGRSDAAWLDTLPDAAAEDPPSARPVTLTRAFLQALDPDHLVVPMLTASADLQILAQVLGRVPMLSAASGWGARFGRELNATEDRPHFSKRDASRRARHDRDEALIVIEGKHLAPFRVVPDADCFEIGRAAAGALIDADSTFRRARLAYRDVASATNRVTLIAAILPPGLVSTHTVFCLKTALDPRRQYCLLALLNSLVANYLVRLQVTTHVTAALMARLPVPKPEPVSPDFGELADLARALEKTGVDANAAAFVRINTIAAGLYGLSHAQYTHVVNTFPLLPTSLRHDCIRAHEDGLRGSETQR